MKEFSRSQRVSQAMQRELAQLIQQHVKDPRLPKFVTVSTVKVSPDFSYAKVYITVLGDETECRLALDILNHAAGFLRTQIGRAIKLRVTPQLKFVYDNTVAYGCHLSKLIDDVVTHDDEQHHQKDEE